MSIQHQKKIRNIIHTMPLDCWCEVILFFNKKEDFFSVVLVVKGLWRHIRTIYPSGTINIPFQLLKLPNCPQPQVSFLKVGGMEDIYKGIEDSDEYMKEMKCSSAENLFEEILKEFCNLKKLHFSLTHLFHYDHDVCLEYMDYGEPNVVQRHVGEWNISQLNLTFREENLGRSLNSIYIILCECDLSINKTFPNVTSLKLIRICKFEESWRNLMEYGEDKDDLFEHSALSICWKCLPSLSILQLAGWDLSKNGIDNIFLEQKINTLSLENCKNLSKNGKIINFKNLSYLEIGAGSLNEIRSLEMLNNLKRIVLDCDGFFFHDLLTEGGNYNRWFGDFEIHQNFVIENLPLLKKLKLEQSIDDLGELRIWNLNTSAGKSKKLLLRNLPSLKKIVLRQSSIGCETINCPSVKKIDSIYSSGVVDYYGVSLRHVEVLDSEIDREKVYLIDNLNSLKNLEVFKFTHLSSEDEVGVDDEEVANWNILRIVSLENLKRLIVNYSHYSVKFGAVVDCPLLRELSVRVDRDFEVKNLPKVEKMHLWYVSGNVRIADFPSLKSLRLFFLFTGTLSLSNLPLETIEFDKVEGLVNLHNLPNVERVKVVTLSPKYADMFFNELDNLRESLKVFKFGRYHSPKIISQHEAKLLLNFKSLVIKFRSCELSGTTSELENINADFSESFHVEKLHNLKKLECRVLLEKIS